MKYFIVFLLGIQFCFAQQDSWMMNSTWYKTNLQYSSNPAFAGENGKLVASNHTQFNLYETNFSDAFSSNSTSVQSNIRDFGIGLSYSNINYASFQQDQNIALSLSYKIPINRSNYLSFGLSGSANQSFVNLNQFTFFDQLNNAGFVYSSAQKPPGMPIIYFTNYSLGTLFRNRNGFIGLSIQNLFEPVIAFYSISYHDPKNRLNRNYRIEAGWRIYTINDFTFYGNAHADFNSLVNYEMLGLQASYKNKLIGGIYYTSNNGLNMMISYYNSHFRLFASYTKEYIFKNSELSNEGILNVGVTLVLK